MGLAYLYTSSDKNALTRHKIVISRCFMIDVYDPSRVEEFYHFYCIRSFSESLQYCCKPISSYLIYQSIHTTNFLVMNRIQQRLSRSSESDTHLKPLRGAAIARRLTKTVIPCKNCNTKMPTYLEKFTLGRLFVPSMRIIFNLFNLCQNNFKKWSWKKKLTPENPHLPIIQNACDYGSSSHTKH